MFDEKTILARLQNGEDAQTIAEEMAAMINAANKMYIDQKAAEETAKVATAKAEVQKREELQKILYMFCDWISTYYEMDVEDLKSDLKADQIIELIDSTKEYIETIKGLGSMFDTKEPAVKVTKSYTKPANADETINAFLKNMGW